MIELLICPVCGATMKKRPNESWPNYSRRTACSVKHARQWRDAKLRIATQGPLNLHAAMRGWKYEPITEGV